MLHERTQASAGDNWTARYALLLWLSIVVLVPFGLQTIDSAVSAAEQAVRCLRGHTRHYINMRMFLTARRSARMPHRSSRAFSTCASASSAMRARLATAPRNASAAFSHARTLCGQRCRNTLPGVVMRSSKLASRTFRFGCASWHVEEVLTRTLFVGCGYPCVIRRCFRIWSAIRFVTTSKYDCGFTSAVRMGKSISLVM